MTYIVKRMSSGEYGVYDTAHASFPVETPDLRAAGVGRLEWMKDGKEAQRIADTLNTFHGLGAVVIETVKDETEDSLADMAQALIDEDKAHGNAA